MKRTLITIALLAVVAVAGIYFIQEAQSASSRSDARAATRESIRETVAVERATQTAQAGARETVTPAPTSTHTPAPDPPATPAPTTGINVGPENRCSPYDPDDYSYPQSVEPRIIAAMAGRIYSPYSGRYFSDRGQTDIEHIVARSEAHDSGLCAASIEARRAFARDLDNLTLSSPEINRYQKVANDLAEWLPEKNRCWYVARVMAVKRKYGLTMDSAEHQAAQAVLIGCSSDTTMIFFDAPPATAQKETQNETDELFEVIDRIMRVLMHQKESPRETIYLAFLLALNDYEGLGGTTRPMGSYFRLPEEDQQRGGL